MSHSEDGLSLALCVSGCVSVGTNQAFLCTPRQGLQQPLQLEIPADSVGLAQV